MAYGMAQIKSGFSPFLTMCHIEQAQRCNCISIVLSYILIIGFGLGVHFLNKCAKIVHDKDYEVMGKFSSVPVYNALKRDTRWRLNTVQRKTPKAGKLMERKSGFRQDVKTWSFKYALNTI